MKNRKTGETAMNKDSSRSHSIFTIYIETAEPVNVTKFSERIHKYNRMDRESKKLRQES